MMWLLSVSLAAPAADTVLALQPDWEQVVEQALEDYPAELELPEAPELYHLRYHQLLGRSLSVPAKYPQWRVGSG